MVHSPPIKKAGKFIGLIFVKVLRLNNGKVDGFVN